MGLMYTEESKQDSIDQVNFIVSKLVKYPKNTAGYKFHRRLLDRAIRYYCDYIPIPFISVAAKNKTDVNLFDYVYHQQYKFDDGRKVFIQEHKYPISDMIEDMLKSPEKAGDILQQVEFGWILKEEDKLLPKNKRGDHDKIYKEAGIELIRNNL